MADNLRMAIKSCLKNFICTTAIVWLIINTNTTRANTDNIEKRLRACASCHEQVALAATFQDYVPSIAGKPVEYLYQQLLNYREGRRQNRVMNQMLAYLSNDYLREIAQYYARQTANQRIKVNDGIKQSLERAKRARYLVQRKNGDQPGCSDCHGGDLRGNGIAIPSLRGLSAAYITAQLGAWKADARHAREPDCMANVAKSLSGTDIIAVANWVANATESMLESNPPMEHLPVPCGAVH